MKRVLPMLVLIAGSWITSLRACELPRLTKDLKLRKQSYQEQKKLPYLKETYFSISPEDLDDGLKVDRLNLPGTEKAVKARCRA
jgi:hypothetical protein